MDSTNIAMFQAADALALSAGRTVVYGRVGAHTGLDNFYRCGAVFTQAWRRLEVDLGTAQRLQQEQLLTVTVLMPADYEPSQDELDAAAAATGSAPGGSSGGSSGGSGVASSEFELTFVQGPVLAVRSK